MRRSVVEKSFVIVLFILVMIAFSFAERDTQKAFEKYNRQNTVETPKKTIDYTAEASSKKLDINKASRN